MVLCMAIGFCGCTEKVEPDKAELDLDKLVGSIELEDGFEPEIGIILGSGLGPLHR